MKGRKKQKDWYNRPSGSGAQRTKCPSLYKFEPELGFLDDTQLSQTQTLESTGQVKAFYFNN